MELYIKDRLYFPSLLPECKSFLEFNLKRQILNKVFISDEDKEKFEITHDPENGTVRWNAKMDADNPKTVEFTKEELTLIQRGCESLDGQPFPDDFWKFVERIWETANK